MFFNRAFANRRAITASLHKSECSTYSKYASASLLLNSLYLPRLFAKVLSVLRYSTKTVLNVQEVRLRFIFGYLLASTLPICKSTVSAALLHKKQSSTYTRYACVRHGWRWVQMLCTSSLLRPVTSAIFSIDNPKRNKFLAVSSLVW